MSANLVYRWDKINPPAKLGEKNPVVERGMAKVLCLAYYGKNDQDFKFCKFCATEAGEGCPGSLGSRVLGTIEIIDKFEEEVAKERAWFVGYKANKSTNKKAMVVTKLFGIHSFKGAPQTPCDRHCSG